MTNSTDRFAQVKGRLELARKTLKDLDGVLSVVVDSLIKDCEMLIRECEAAAGGWSNTIDFMQATVDQHKELQRTVDLQAVELLYIRQQLAITLKAIRRFCAQVDSKHLTPDNYQELKGILERKEVDKLTQDKLTALEVIADCAKGLLAAVDAERMYVINQEDASTHRPLKDFLDANGLPDAVAQYNKLGRR